MKHQFSITAKYVSHWSIERALSEIALNGIERANEEKGAKFDFSQRVSDSKHRVLFRNRNSSLSMKNLCLGDSSKDKHFGEGLKLAILVLTREGKEVKIAFGRNRWAFTIEYSKVYGTEVLTLTTSVDKSKNLKDLVIQVSGITYEEYTSFGSFFLEEEETEPVFKNKYGYITREHKSCYLEKMNTLEETYFGYSLNSSCLLPNRERTSIKNPDLVFRSLIEGYLKELYERERYEEFAEILYEITGNIYGNVDTGFTLMAMIRHFNDFQMFRNPRVAEVLANKVESDVYIPESITEYYTAQDLGIKSVFESERRALILRYARVGRNVSEVKDTLRKEVIRNFCRANSITYEDIKTITEILKEEEEK